VIAVNVRVDVLGGLEIRGLLMMASELKFVELFGAASGKADLSVDRTGGLTEDCLFGGDEPSVTRKILADPSAGLGGNETRLALAL
jgi:hypothetical protein